MKKLFKYIGFSFLLIFSFYYTEKFSGIIINNSELMYEINDNKDKYDIMPVNAIINDNYITPGLNGYSVNTLKSYDKMRHLNTFNSYYLEYDLIKPVNTIDNNKDKIIRNGNGKKNKVSIIIKNNNDIIEYIINKNIKISRLVNISTISKENKYEQINNDFNNYKKTEILLNKYNINNNICYIKNDIDNICKKENKYLIEETITLNKYNLSDIKSKIRSGYIIYVGDDVSLIDFKILLKQIYYQDLEIDYLSNLIKEDID